MCSHEHDTYRSTFNMLRENSRPHARGRGSKQPWRRRYDRETDVARTHAGVDRNLHTWRAVKHRRVAAFACVLNHERRSIQASHGVAGANRHCVWRRGAAMRRLVLSMFFWPCSIIPTDSVDLDNWPGHVQCGPTGCHRSPQNFSPQFFWWSHLVYTQMYTQ